MATISIHNRSSRHQRRWVTVPLDPKTDAAMPSSFCALAPGQWFLRGPRVGDHSVLWHLFADVQPGEHQAVTEAAKPVDAPRIPFQLSAWIADDLRGAVPYARVRGRINGQETEVRLVPELVSWDGDDVRRVAHFRVASHGWHMELWCDTWTMQDVVDFRGYVVWSDNGSQAVRQDMTVTLHCGERFVLHYTGKDTRPPAAAVLLQGPVIDAVPIPFRGSVLCAPTPNPDATEATHDEFRMQLLEAAAGGPVTAPS